MSHDLKFSLYCNILPLNHFKLSMNIRMKEITLIYGPNEVLGVFKRNPRRLDRLTAALTTLGFTVNLKKSRHRDRLEMLLNDSKIFQCRMSYFKYHPNKRNDETLQKAIYAAIEAAARFQQIKEHIYECQ